VVQRVPVRLEINPQELAEHPLRVGLSMQAEVDVADQAGPPLLGSVAARTSSQTTVFQSDGAEADRRVRQIIANQLGKAVRG
jgi:membrane fusion protein, multidrug efflux system